MIKTEINSQGGEMSLIVSSFHSVRSSIRCRSMSALILVGLVLFSSVGNARENCGAKINELEIANCAQSNFQEADAALNVVFTKLENLLEDSNNLRKAQHAWVTFRDADCEYETQEQSGSRIGFSWHYSCIEKKTRVRTEELQKYLENAQSGCSQCPRIKKK